MSDERPNPARPADAGADAPADDRVVAEHTQRPSAPAPAPTPAPAPAVLATAEAGEVRETLYKLPGSREQVPATQATGAELRSITATTVLMDRSGAQGITAERVQME